jgi:hypothetical protein
MPMNEVERLKGEGRYFHAGVVAAAQGDDNGYGCHFGMRSSLEYARAEFKRGHEEALEAMRLATTWG